MRFSAASAPPSGGASGGLLDLAGFPAPPAMLRTPPASLAKLPFFLLRVPRVEKNMRADFILPCFLGDPNGVTVSPRSMRLACARNGKGGGGGDCGGHDRAISPRDQTYAEDFGAKTGWEPNTGETVARRAPSDGSATEHGLRGS